MIEERLNQFVSTCIVKRPIDRKEYSATPLHIIDAPDATYYSEFADVIPTELDHLIDEQAIDGAWEPNWSWYRFEEDWKIAREEWKGIITLKNLKTLRNFDRILF